MRLDAAGSGVRRATGHPRAAWLLAMALLGGACDAPPQPDANADGYVDILDASLVGTCMGLSDPGADPRCARADVDGDGTVGSGDLRIVYQLLGAVLFDPEWPAFTPESVHLTRDGVLLLHASSEARIHRWSLATGRALAPIALGPGSRFVAYSETLDRIHVGYSDGRITWIDASLPLAEAAFTSLAFGPYALTSLGDLLFATTSTGAGYGFTFSTFRPDGTLADAESGSARRSNGYVWSAANERLYHFRDGTSPNDLYWHAIDAETGEFQGARESPYHDDYLILHPIRPSRDGSLVLLGSGNLYDGLTLELRGSLALRPRDALWLEDGGLLTLTDDGSGGTLLRHWSPELRPYSLGHYAGTPVRVLGGPTGFAVVTQIDGRPVVHSYVARADADLDGTPNDQDAFPLDPAASQDSDGDGHPDAWNPGQGPEDSSQGLSLDAFPLDSACHLAEHGLPGQPEVCDIASRIPAYLPARIEVDVRGVAHLLSPENDRIYRWSLAEGRHLNPIDVGDVPQHLAGSAENGRLYLGYGSGLITQLDPAETFPREAFFATTPESVIGLQTAGRFVFAVDPSGSWDSHYTFAPDGTQISEVEWNRHSREIAWSPANERMYFFRDATSPNDLEWERIDPATGAITDSGESPYHGKFAIVPPIRVSPDGALVLLGSGDFYDGITLEMEGSLPQPVTDALWHDQGLLTIRPDGAGGTIVEQRGLALVLESVASLEGQPLRVLNGSGSFHIVTLRDGRPAFTRWALDGDGDDDGVANADDAFPMDPAASVDTDRDGHPDAWNPGAGPEDSTSGLTLDAFPLDFGCQRPEHGIDGVCDIVTVLPPSVETPLCELDGPAPAADSGWLEMGATGDFVPLCDGWLLISDAVEDGVTLRNVVNGREGAFFALPSRPADLELDEARKLLYAALPDQEAVAEVDLRTGAVEVIPIGGFVTWLALGPDGGLFAGVPDGSDSELYWVAADATTPVGGWSVSGRLGRYNPVAGELVVVELTTTFAALTRYAFDPATGPVLVQWRRGGNSVGSDLAISPDGAHLVFAVSGGNGSGPTLYDFSPTNLEQVDGAWATGYYPTAVGFDRRSERLLVSNRTTILVFDVVGKGQLDAHQPPTCDSVQIDRTAASRGGTLGLGRQTCGPDRTRFHWFRMS